MADVVQQAETWMAQIYKSGLPGKYEAWSYQHGILPRLLWPLLVYEVLMATVENLERKIKEHLYVSMVQAERLEQHCMAQHRKQAVIAT